MRAAVRLAVLASVVAASGCPRPEAPAPAAAPAAPATDLAGRVATPFAGDPPTVLLFVRTDCPISNRYAPVIRALAERYAGRVRFYSVFVAPDESASSVQTYMREYAPGTIPLLDPAHALVRRAGATVTPEAALFDADDELVYRGRIDDRYIAFGKARPRATVHDLADAIEAVLEGTPIARPRTPAVGCYIRDVKA